MTSITPLISVIIPVYNGEKHIRKCVDSILSQTYTNLEIILVDDGSIDTSSQLCEQYAQKDARIKTIHQSNGGVAAARNSGIKAAKGEYLTFIDQDDWVDPIFIETLWHLISKYQSSIASVGQCIVSSREKIQKDVLPHHQAETLINTAEESFTAQQALRMTFAPYGLFVTNKLFHHSLFEHSLFPAGSIYEDIWILYRLFQHVNKMAVRNTPLSYWNRQNENSQSRGKFRINMLDYFKVTDEFLACANQNKDTYMLRKLQRNRLAHICGFFKRMILSDFADPAVIKPLKQELRRNLWLLLLYPRPLRISMFGVACAISFPLTKQIFLRLPQRIKEY